MLAPSLTLSLASPIGSADLLDCTPEPSLFAPRCARTGPDFIGLHFRSLLPDLQLYLVHRGMELSWLLCYKVELSSASDREQNQPALARDCL